MITYHIFDDIEGKILGKVWNDQIALQMLRKFLKQYKGKKVDVIFKIVGK